MSMAGLFGQLSSYQQGARNHQDPSSHGFDPADAVDTETLLQYLADSGSGNAQHPGTQDALSALTLAYANANSSDATGQQLDGGSSEQSAVLGMGSTGVFGGRGGQQQQGRQHIEQAAYLQQHNNNNAGPGHGGNHSSSAVRPYPNRGYGGGASAHNPTQPTARQPPSSSLMTSTTDPMQTAVLINYTFTQPGATFYVLHTHPEPHGPEAGASGNAALHTALQAVLSARRMNQQSGSGYDIGFVPFLAGEGNVGSTDKIGLLVYRCTIPPSSAKGSAPQGQLLKVEGHSNPVLAGLALYNYAMQSSSTPTEVLFHADSVKVALQTLATARLNLTAVDQDVILMLQAVDWPVNDGGSGGSPHFHVRLTPTSQVLPCFQRQFDARLQAQNATGGTDQAHHPVQAHVLGVHGADDFVYAGTGAMHEHLAAANSAAMHQRQPQLAAHFGTGGSAAGTGGSAAPGWNAGGHAGGLTNGSTTALTAKQLRARKADYVIVTEETAIKNAAGAVAKVLGRLSGGGGCCPLYTEKKTEGFTAVVSVAVKAIAVARGYVINENTGHEVGFQPYLRNGERGLDVVELQQHLVERKVAAMQQQASASAHNALGLMGRPRSSGIGGNKDGGNGLALGPMGQLMGQLGARAGGNGFVGGAFGGGIGSGADSVDLSEMALQDERCELAFDVFKVPMMHPDTSDAGSLPVKVTAHSRPNVVSNILHKLISERESAILITAGGKAMHVAITAVVSARARLRARGLDVMLLPKFVTVDTTSTLGWESVFLRFHIVRWPISGEVPSIPLAPALQLHMQQQLPPLPPQQFGVGGNMGAGGSMASGMYGAVGGIKMAPVGLTGPRGPASRMQQGQYDQHVPQYGPLGGGGMGLSQQEQESMAEHRYF